MYMMTQNIYSKRIQTLTEKEEVEAKPDFAYPVLFIR